jgi:hypothetical protein
MNPVHTHRSSFFKTILILSSYKHDIVLLMVQVENEPFLVLHQWRRTGEWRYSSTIFNLDTRWRWVVSFTLLLLYRLGKSVRYPLYRRLDGIQSRSGRCEELKNLLPLPGTEPQFLMCPAHHYTEVSQLSVSPMSLSKPLHKSVTPARLIAIATVQFRGTGHASVHISEAQDQFINWSHQLQFNLQGQSWRCNFLPRS